MEITDKEFENEVLKARLPVFIEFWASWCPPCKMMEPVMKKLAEEYQGKVKVCKLNIDKNRVTASKFDISGVPTFMVLKEGKVIRKEVAAKAESELRKIIEEMLQ